MKRQKSPKHLERIRTYECIICGDNTSVEGAHIRFGDPRVKKRPTGMGEKPDDVWAVPLCSGHHAMQHRWGDEKGFWAAIGIDPIFYAMAIRLELWP